MARMLENGGFWTNPVSVRSALTRLDVLGWGPGEAASEKRIGVLTVHVGGECPTGCPQKQGSVPPGTSGKGDETPLKSCSHLEGPGHWVSA